MPQTINTNLASLNAQRNLNASQASLTTSLQRLSSGLRINSAKDDAAGLAISERMGAQIRGLDQAARNSNDAISLAQTAEGNLSEISNILQRMREISVQAANDTNTPADRQSLQNEVASLTEEIDRIATTAQFNDKVLLDGNFGTANFQVGANAGQTISMSISSAKNSDLGLLMGGSATVTGTAGGTNAIANTGLMTINGVAIGASTTDGVSYVGGALAGTTSALAAKNAINAATGTNVTATAANTITSDQVTATGGMVAGDMFINGHDIGALSNGTNTVLEQTEDIVAAINNLDIGVTALKLTSSTYSLSNTDGSNIDITSYTTAGHAEADASGFTVHDASISGVAGTTGTAVTNYGSLTLTSSNAGINITGTAIQGLTVYDTAASASTGDLSVNSQHEAAVALELIDVAINTINAQRATLGTNQTRFDSVISNLHTSSENLSAARGRIRDTDFAAETANMTRSQVLQQAGVAMLAQANALPNIVLSLLK
jgi:flagellin